jgi:hypothetical protein
MGSNHTQTDVVSQLHDWLRTTGYALEFRTAETLRQRDWRPSVAAQIQGRKNSDVPRDVDVIGQRCFHTTGSGKRIKTVGYLLIECKHVAPETAWMLLGKHPLHETRSAPAYVPRAVGLSSGRGGIGIPIQTTRTPPGPNDRVVSSGVCVGLLKNGSRRSNDLSARPDSAYAAVSKVKELAWSLAAECRSWDTSAEYASEVFVIPCVVVKGTLARVDFSTKDATPVIQEVEAGAILLNTPPETTLVHVIQEQSFPNFVDECTRMNQSWNNHLARPVNRYRRRAATGRNLHMGQSRPTT